ncbi:hypothetical protein KML24007_04380 [Alistipes indistinctus]|uniref:CHAT domain-containing protein n=1 Tax=Alistipes indistinctus TaxID=626932 RepID=UPI0036F3FF4E
MNGSCLKFLFILAAYICVGLECDAAGTSPIGNSSWPQWLRLEIEKAQTTQDLSDPRTLQVWVYEKGREMESEGNIERALESYILFYSQLKATAAFEFAINPNHEHSVYWKQTTRRLKAVQRFCVEYLSYNPGLARLCFELELFMKSLMLDFSSRVHRKIMESGDEEFISDWNTVMRGRDYLDKAMPLLKQLEPHIETIRQNIVSADSISKALVEHYDRKLQSLRGVDTMNLAAKSVLIDKAMQRYPGIFDNIHLGYVAKSLRESDALVEYFTYPGKKGETVYGVFVIRPGYDYPEIEILGDEAMLLRHLDGNVDFDGLYRYLWEPVNQLIGDCADIYVIPSGILHKVPFAALCNSVEYISDKHTIHTLLSSKDIVGINDAGETFVNNAILLLGGADFDYMQGGESPTPDTTNVPDDANITENMLRSSRGQGFGYLPGSLREIETIREILWTKEWRVRLLTDTEATKTTLQNDLSKFTPDILHISTHGFWIPSPVSDDAPNRNMFRIAENPLMRSGLVFSGVNILWNMVYPPGIDNGVLTAQEISRMNLSGTGLVVLSACETGAGAINDSEGVYGLQRGFRLAGARKMLLSLWEVPDKETTDMMISFYHYLVSGHSVKQSFDMAQKDMRVKNPDNPESWAGFVLIE